MGYVPLLEKQGFQLKIEDTELKRKIYVRNETAIWINEYSRTKAKGAYSQWYLVAVYLDRNLSPDEIASIKKTAEQKAIDEIFKNNEKIGGFYIVPPTGLSYKDLVKWYEGSILGLIKKQTELAISLGEDPNKVGKVVVEATKTLFQVSTAAFAVIGASSATATVSAVTAGATAIGGAAFAAVFGPIGIGVLSVVTLLDAFGVFSSDTLQREADAVTYAQLSFVLKKWYEEYGLALTKMNAIDLAEFNKYMQTTYGGVSTENGNTESLVNSSPTPTTSTNYWYWVLALILIILITIVIRKGRT